MSTATRDDHHNAINLDNVELERIQIGLGVVMGSDDIDTKAYKAYQALALKIQKIQNDRRPPVQTMHGSLYNSDRRAIIKCSANMSCQRPATHGPACSQHTG